MCNRFRNPRLAKERIDFAHLDGKLPLVISGRIFHQRKKTPDSFAEFLSVPRLGIGGIVVGSEKGLQSHGRLRRRAFALGEGAAAQATMARSEEHTSELQSRQYLVC